MDGGGLGGRPGQKAIQGPVDLAILDRKVGFKVKSRLIWRGQPLGSSRHSPFLRNRNRQAQAEDGVTLKISIAMGSKGSILARLLVNDLNDPIDPINKP
jgi:hypothetical protein